MDKQTHVTIGTSKGTYDMPVATWDAIGILVNAHYQLMQDLSYRCSGKKAARAEEGLTLLTRIIKRMNRN